MSQAGQALFLAALLLIAGSGTAGPLRLSGVFAATLAAGVLAGLPGGALVDRLGAAPGFGLGVLLRLMAVTAAVALSGAPSWAWTAAFAYSAGSQVFSSAEMALIPLLQRGGSARAHGLLIGLQYAGQGAGAIALAPLLLAGGSVLVLGAAAMVYVLLLVPAGLLVVRLWQAQPVHAGRARRSLLLGETFRFLRNEPRAIYAIALLAFIDVTMKGAVIAVPRYLVRDLGLNDVELIAVLGLGAFGAVSGFFWVMRWHTPQASARLMRLTLATVAGTLFPLALLQPAAGLAGQEIGVELLVQIGDSTPLGLALALAAAVVLGLCFSLAPITARAVLTDTAPIGQQARVFASQATLAHAAVIVPLLLAGAGTQVAGPRPILACLGLIGLALLLVLEPLRARPHSTAQETAVMTPASEP